MHSLTTHPAVRLGRFLKAVRSARGIVKRLFAGQIMLSPSAYTEVEAGVVRWLQEPQRKAILSVCDFTDAQIKTFLDLLDKARKAVALVFANLFTREDLEPIRFRFNDSIEQAREFEKTTILNAVFADI